MTASPKKLVSPIDDTLMSELLLEETQFRNKRAPRKSLVVYQILKRQILIGELTHNSAITEQSLAQEFSCSQGTVREALLSLQEDGLVERRGYQGTFVTYTSLEEAILLARIRMSLECEGLTDKTLTHMRPEQMVRMRKLAMAYIQAREAKDPFAVSEFDRALHLAIFKLNAMPGLVPVLTRCLLLLHRCALAGRIEQVPWNSFSPDPHSKILDALQFGQIELARNLLAEHISSFFENLMPEVHAVALPMDIKVLP